MRVAYLINAYPKVSHTFVRREIQAVERLGIAVTRIALRGWDSVIVDEQDRLERQQTLYVLRGWVVSLLWAVPVVLFSRPIPFFKAVGLALRMGWRADRPFPLHLIYLMEACIIAVHLRRRAISHLHAHFGTNSAEVAMLVNVLTGVPWSFTVHGPEEFDKPEFIGLREKVHRSDFVVAVSSFGRSQLYRWAELNHWHKIHVVHCGLDTEFLAEHASGAGSLRQLVCVGRICEQKGQVLLVHAAKKLADEGCNFNLVLAGDGEMRPAIEELIRHYRLQDRIQITGWLDGAGVRSAILASRALVLPSFAEGLPVVIMEAMALGRPIISTYVAGIPELVVPGETGWLVPPGDLGALIDAVRTCLTTSCKTIDEMGRSGTDRVHARHSAEREARKIARLFRDSAGPLGKTADTLHVQHGGSELYDDNSAGVPPTKQTLP